MRSNNEHCTTNCVSIVQTVILGLVGVPVTLGLFWAMSAFVEFVANTGLVWWLLGGLLVALVVVVAGGERL